MIFVAFQVCLHSTRALPGAQVDEDSKLNYNQELSHDEPISFQDRIWSLFGSQKQGKSAENGGQTAVKIGPWQEVCTEWANDTDATPTLFFRKPKRLF